jgi:hypothetical protein
LTEQFTALYQRRQMSRAQQQFALLRRCFYPKRDVIKWDKTWARPSCEVHTVQEPLTRLPFGANSTCVELPYTTMLWFGVALEDRTWRGSLSLGEHVLYAHPSVEDIYSVGFEIHNLKPGTSGAWFGSSPGYIQYLWRSHFAQALLKYTVPQPSIYAAFSRSSPHNVRIMFKLVI